MDVVFVVVGIDPNLTASTVKLILQNEPIGGEESSPFLIWKRPHKSDNIYVMHAPRAITSQEFSKLKKTAEVWGSVLVLVVASCESSAKDTVGFLEELGQPLIHENAKLIFTYNSDGKKATLDLQSKDTKKLTSMFTSDPVWIDTASAEDGIAKIDELVQFVKRKMVIGATEQVFDDCKKTFKCIILGSKKSGKSSLGNIILNQHAFKVNFYDNNPTTEVKTALMEKSEGPYNVFVVDTPSTLDDSAMKALRQTEKVPDVKYVLVFSFEDKDILPKLDYLETKIANLKQKAIIAVTHTDELANIVEDDSEKTFKKYIEMHNKGLSKLLHEFGNRHVFVSNVPDPSHKQRIRMGILHQIEKMLK